MKIKRPRLGFKIKLFILFIGLIASWTFRYFGYDNSILYFGLLLIVIISLLIFYMPDK